VIVAKCGGGVLEVPSDGEASEVFERAVFSGASDFGLLVGALGVAESVVEIEPEITGVEIE
jgi:hypothetical protein